MRPPVSNASGTKMAPEPEAATVAPCQATLLTAALAAAEPDMTAASSTLDLHVGLVTVTSPYTVALSASSPVNLRSVRRRSVCETEDGSTLTRTRLLRAIDAKISLEEALNGNERAPPHTHTCQLLSLAVHKDRLNRYTAQI